MTDWIVSKLPDGEVRVTSSNRAILRQTFSDSEEWGEATRGAFEFIEGEFKWGDRILTQEVKW